MLLNSPMGGVRGALIAFLGGLFFTGYVFLSERVPHDETAHWPLFGIELLTMATWASLIVLLFGNWQAVHPTLPKDALVILYVAGACTFLPTLLTVVMQKYISAVTISFIYILEPVLGAGIATLYLHEALPLVGYIGGSLVVAGAVTHTWGTAGRSASHHSQEYVPTPAYRHMAFSPWSRAGYQLLRYSCRRLRPLWNWWISPLFVATRVQTRTAPAFPLAARTEHVYWPATGASIMLAACMDVAHWDELRHSNPYGIHALY